MRIYHENCFLTGATGGLGNYVYRFVQKGWQVFAVGTNNEKLRELKQATQCNPINANVCDIDNLKAAKENCLNTLIAWTLWSTLQGYLHFLLVEGRANTAYGKADRHQCTGHRPSQRHHD